MARLLDVSRHLILGTAFLAVMAGTGGLIGAVGGVVMVLLSRAVLGMATGMAEFMSAGIGLGVLISLALGVFLAVHQNLPSVPLPRVASAPPSETQHL